MKLNWILWLRGPILELRGEVERLMRGARITHDEVLVGLSM